MAKRVALARPPHFRPACGRDSSDPGVSALRQVTACRVCQQSPMALATTTAATAGLGMLAVLSVGLVRSATVRRLGSARAAALAIISRLIQVLEIAKARLDPPPPWDPPRARYAMHLGWSQLNDREKLAAMSLFYTEATWGQNQADPRIIFTFWAQLTHEQQEAAHTLGYRQEIWDEEVLVDAEAAGFPDGA